MFLRIANVEKKACAVLWYTHKHSTSEIAYFFPPRSPLVSGVGFLKYRTLLWTEVIPLEGDQALGRYRPFLRPTQHIRRVFRHQVRTPEIDEVVIKVKITPRKWVCWFREREALCSERWCYSESRNIFSRTYTSALCGCDNRTRTRGSLSQEPVPSSVIALHHIPHHVSLQALQIFFVMGLFGNLSW